MDKRKIRDYMSRTGLGVFLICICVAMVSIVVYCFAPFLGKAKTVVGYAGLMGVEAAVLWYVCAFAVALSKGQYEKADTMALLSLAGGLLLAVGFFWATVSNFIFSSITWDKEVDAEPWQVAVPGEEGKAAFAVEYINAHPFLAEYDKTIVFKSGKRIGVWIDTGGAGPFAVYRLPTGEYYLVDGLEYDFIRSDYRVNVTNETVEMMCDETWVNIPEGAIKVDSRANDSITAKTADGEKRADGGMPVGDSLTGRRYLGLIHPSGKFEPGEGDPYADIIEPKWNPIKLDGGEVPFSLECRRLKGSRHYRLVFASGARIALGSDSCTGDEGYSLYALEDGRYHLFNAGQKDISWRKEWRINVTDESVEVMFKDHWNKYGDLWVKIPSGATSVDGGIRIRGGEDGKPLSVSIDVNTEGGKVTGHEFTPVGETLANETFIGTFLPPDDDPRLKGRKRERK